MGRVSPHLEGPHLESHPAIVAGGLWAVVKLLLGIAGLLFIVGYGATIILWALTHGLHDLGALSEVRL